MLLKGFACFFMLTSAMANMSIRLNVNEEMPAETVVGQLSSHKAMMQLAAQHKQKLNFTLPKANPFFTVDETNGLVKTRVRIDREALCTEISTCCQAQQIFTNQPDCVVPLQVLVSPLREFVQVEILVVDVNDHAPVFLQSPMTTFVPENEAAGRFCIDLPLAVDPDSAANSVKDYRLDPVSNAFKLRVNSRPTSRFNDLCLLVMEALDREKVQSYALRVIAIDGGNPAKTGTLSLTVRVVDTNDNRPVFSNASYSISIPEHTVVNTPVLRVHATDADEGDHGSVVYSFLLPSGDARDAAGAFLPPSTDRVGPFFINSESGQIVLENPLDYEETRVYHLRVLARDSAAQPRFSTQTVVVQVTNVNDCAPEIEILPIRLVNGPAESNDLQVFENEPAGTTIGMVTVTDRDERLAQASRCLLSSSHFRLVPFDGEPNKFKIVTQMSFDREDVPRFEVIMRCEDSGMPSQVSETSFTVSVLDRDDNAARFASNETVIHVRENNELNQVIGSIQVVDADAEQSRVHFEVRQLDAEASAFPLITIANETGEVLANTVFDRESRETYQFAVRMIRAVDSSVSTSRLVLIIDDANDEAPRFVKIQYEFEVTENAEAHTMIGKVHARDVDGSNAVRYSLAQPNPKFSVKETGEVFVTSSLDRETTPEYAFQVVAHDNGTPEMSSAVLVRVKVTDLNDNKPVFSWPNADNHTINVSMDALPGVIARVAAQDADQGDNGRVSYSMQKRAEAESPFEIDGQTGNVILMRSYSESDRRLYKLIIEATDSGKPSQRELTVLSIVFTERAQSQIDESSAQSDPSTSRLIIVACAAMTTLTLALLVLSIVYVCMRRGRSQRDAESKHEGRFTRSSSSDYEAAQSNDTESESAGSSRTSPVSGLLARSASRTFSVLDRVPIDKPYCGNGCQYERGSVRASCSTNNFRTVSHMNSMLPDFYSSSESFASKRSMSDEHLSAIKIDSKYDSKRTFCVARPHVADFIPIAARHANSRVPADADDYNSLSDENGSDSSSSSRSHLPNVHGVQQYARSNKFGIAENPMHRQLSYNHCHPRDISAV